MIDVIRYNLDLIRLFCFLLFLLAGVRIFRAKSPADRRTRISFFIAFTVAAHLAVGLTQRDAWPISPYPLMRGQWDDQWQYSKIVLVSVDGTGREWPIDPMAWSPVYPLVLQEWFLTYYPTLSRKRQLASLDFLLTRVERARQDTRAGRRTGNEKILGPLTAPDWWLYERARAASPEPIEKLRVYQDFWFPSKRAKDPSAFDRKLIDEYARR